MKVRLLPFLLSFVLLAFHFVPIHSNTSSPPSETISVERPVTKSVTSPVEAKLLSEVQSIKPGENFWVGIELQIAEGWDTYWINPGDSGIATNVQWQLPEGFSVGSLHWPYPEKFTNDTMVGFGYTHTVLLLAEVTPPMDLKETTHLKAKVQWLACKEQCMPGSAEVALTLPVNATVSEKDPKNSASFTQARAQLPQSLAQNALSASSTKEEIILNFKPGMGDFGEIVEAFFVPEKGEIIDYAAPQKLVKSKESYHLNIKRAPQAKQPEAMKGVLIIEEKGSLTKKAIHVDTTLLPASSVAASPTAASYPIELALLCAFVGGIILNVMPCVLPVVALKIFSFVKMAGEDKKEILKQGGLFAFGVIVSFWVLSAILLILRASGEGIGWGFQLQEPIFVASLTIILFLLGLSLLGVFELGTSLIGMGQKAASKGGFFKGSFMSGVLATLVATPCTGPLLGPAVGLAMTIPAIGSLAIFTSMGLGMAAPYLLLAAFPKLIRFLPKPGNWMVLFKQLLGFLMMATCIWLIWVFGGETTHLALLILLFALLLVGIAAWVYGKYAHLGAKKMTRLVATAVALFILTLGGAAGISAARMTQNDTTITHQASSSWQPFSVDKVQELRSQGKAVFVDFTAKWCLICQTNKVTLHSTEIEKAFAEKNVVPLMADWTKKDQAIGDVLQQLGRSGVPVYLLYPADLSKPPLILPQTLSRATVQEYLNQI